MKFVRKTKSMFESARLKLTAWYVLLIMFVSLVFSVAFYNSSTRQIQLLIKRIESTERPDKPRCQAPLFVDTESR
jgi:hypothetical protein